ncbi:hypothetical protein D9M70_609940 [compost metagenome]
MRFERGRDEGAETQHLGRQIATGFRHRPGVGLAIAVVGVHGLSVLAPGTFELAVSVERHQGVFLVAVPLAGEEGVAVQALAQGRKVGCFDAGDLVHAGSPVGLVCIPMRPVAKAHQ